MQSRNVLFSGTYPLIYSNPWSFYMRSCYIRAYFWSPYLSNLTRSTCTFLKEVDVPRCCWAYFKITVNLIWTFCLFFFFLTICLERSKMEWNIICNERIFPEKGNQIIFPYFLWVLRALNSIMLHWLSWLVLPVSNVDVVVVVVAVVVVVVVVV